MRSTTSSCSPASPRRPHCRPLATPGPSTPPAPALAHQVNPPTIKVTKPLAALQQPNGPLYVATEKRPWMPSADHPRRAAVSAFGFGGSNFHAVLEEGDPVKHEIDWTGDVEIL